MINFINFINYSILIFFIFSVIIYSLLLIGSFPAIISYFKKATVGNIYALLNSSELPPVTIITPVYNEQDIIEECCLSLLASEYKNLYIILVNDGSNDNTLNLLKEKFQLKKEPVIIKQTIKTAKVKDIYVSSIHTNLMVIDKEHSNTGDTLNVGLNACFTPYFATVDADSIIDKHAISELMYELLSKPNTIAVGGGVYILNSCKYTKGKLQESKMPYQLVPALQTNEYIRSHLFNRTGWNSYGGSMSYSGTASLFSREEVVAVNGYDANNYAQDTEMIMRLHYHMNKNKKKYQIRFNPSATVWTDVPHNLLQFTKQRDKWRRGMLKSVLNYLVMFFNPKYKVQGLFAYPMYVILEIIAPFVEVTAYITLSYAYYLGILNTTSAILYIILAWGFTSYLTIANMFINLITFNRYKKLNDILWMFLLAVIEMFGFRQYHVIVKVWGSFHYFINRLLGRPL
jgi:poly-beta-1,6-N-acetyl-D-glucosamine synthase